MPKVDDSIQELLTRDTGHTFTTEALVKLGAAVAEHLEKALTPRNPDRGGTRLFASDLGDQCIRRVWFKVHGATTTAYPMRTVEPLPASTKFKFLYGNVVEELALVLAEQTGHVVDDRQLRVVHTHVTWSAMPAITTTASVISMAASLVETTGRMDCTIDGAVVDVKSASTRAMQKYSNVLEISDDTFGYLEQLWFYHYYSPKNPEHKAPNVDQGIPYPYFLFVDRTLGHVKRVEAGYLPKSEIDLQIERKAQAILKPTPPETPIEMEPVPEGKSGNKKLCLQCSYCAYKASCWNYTTYGYSNGPVFMTHVERPPAVPVIGGSSAI